MMIINAPISGRYQGFVDVLLISEYILKELCVSAEVGVIQYGKKYVFNDLELNKNSCKIVGNYLVKIKQYVYKFNIKMYFFCAQLYAGIIYPFMALRFCLII